MANLKITTSDPGNRLASLPQLAPTIAAAVDYIDRYVVFKGTVDVAVVVETTSTGRFAGNGDTAFVAHRDGRDLWEASMVAESRNGVDPHPDTPDFTIYIDPQSSYLAGLWWDPAIATSLDGAVPIDRTDAFTVIVHELLHGMGIVGWRDITSGALPGDYQSVWDSQVAVLGGRATFNGAATTALLGQPLEVRLGGSQGAFHFGNAPTNPDDELSGSHMPWVEASNFNSYYYFLGERYLLGRLELAVLQDLGWTLEPTTLTDVVNRWDDRVAERYMVGWDSDEQLVGDALADRLEGRGGNDRLAGLDGDDLLDGGAGNDELAGGGGDDRLAGGPGLDSATYERPHDRYRVTLGAEPSVADSTGGDGRDTLDQVERLRFADESLALDLDGNAGTVARLLGALFDAPAVQNKAAVGIGLKLLDGGMTRLQLAQAALDVRLGAGAAAAAVVSVLYTNVVGQAPSPEVQADFVRLLDNGTYTPATLTLAAADVDLNAAQIDFAGLQTHGLPYLPG